MKLPFLYRVAEKASSDVLGMNQQGSRQMFFINAAALVFTFFLMVFHLISGSSADLFIVDILFISAFLVSTLSLFNGMIRFSLNATFFYPIIIYFTLISDFFSYAPVQETLRISLFGLLLATGFLSVFSASFLRLAGFFMVSLITLTIHAKKAGMLDTYLSPDQDFFINPFLIYLLLSGIMLLVRFLYKRQLAETEHQLHKVRENMKDLFKGIRFPAIHLKMERDLTGKITSVVTEGVNPAFEKVFMLENSDLKGLNTAYFFQKVFNGNLTPEDIYFGDFENRREIFIEKTGKWFAILVMKPDKYNYYVVFNDITGEKQIISELMDSRQRYRVLLEAIPDIFFIIGIDGTYRDFVIKTEDKLKVNDSEVIGKTIFEVGFSELMSGKIMECIQSSISNNTIEIIEYGLNTDHGSFVFEMRIARLNENAVISIARDISRRKQAEFNLLEAKEKVEEVLRLKSVFLASLSHNIRTPMNIILGFSKMLCDTEQPGFDRDFLIKGISQNSHLLLKMIDDTINLSKIETNTVELKSGHVQINYLLRNLYSYFSGILPDRQNINIEVHEEVNSNEFGFITDYDLLFETLKNLVDNAIKFSQKGTIRFGYNLRPGNQIEFFVEDEGIGISVEEQKYIFDRFYVGKAHRTESAGSGLGLPIAQHFVALLGGELMVETKSGVGSRFYFLLRLREGKGYLRIVS